MKGIRIENLYGRFNYKILFSEKGMTIITGPNGFGKSTILDIIYAMSNSNIEYFFDLYFSEIEILQENEKENFLIEKKEDNLLILGQKFNRQNFMDWKKYYYRRGQGEILGNTDYDNLMYKISDIIVQIKDIVASVFLINEQRLIKIKQQRSNRWDKISEPKIIHTVEELPDNLRYYMNKVARSYSEVANELDSTFPQRLFAQKNGLTSQEFVDNLRSMKEKVQKLQKYEITNFRQLDDIQFKEEDARALNVYFRDFEEKYKQYEKLINQLDMFTSIVNKRFKFKKIYISRNSGIDIIDEKKHYIPLNKLSSGEKETLVLFFQIIFDVPEKSILLVDEPEISLHIAWQRLFADDMQTIAQNTGIQVLIATHSVQIINGNSKIQRDLGRQYADGLDKRELN